jgi:hypothetical protein
MKVKRLRKGESQSPGIVVLVTDPRKSMKNRLASRECNGQCLERPLNNLGTGV